MSDQSHSKVIPFVSGWIGGVAGKVVEYPFDTVKVRLQTGGGTLYTGPVDCVLKTFRNEGPLAFYKGLSTPLVGAGFEASILFFSYHLFERAMKKEGEKEIGMGRVMLAGGGAGLGSTIVLTPVELIKCKLQVQQGVGKYSGPIDCVKQIIKEEGIRGLSKGGLSTLLREIPGNAAWFGGYQAVSRFLGGTGSSSSAGVLPQLLAGAVAGCLYWGVPYPIDTIKSAIQTLPKESNPTILKVGKQIIKEQGIRGLYRGFTVTMVRACPGNAVCFMVAEQVSNSLKNRG